MDALVKYNEIFSSKNLIHMKMNLEDIQKLQNTRDK